MGPWDKAPTFLPFRAASRTASLGFYLFFFIVASYTNIVSVSEASLGCKLVSSSCDSVHSIDCRYERREFSRLSNPDNKKFISARDDGDKHKERMLSPLSENFQIPGQSSPRGSNSGHRFSELGHRQRALRPLPSVLFKPWIISRNVAYVAVFLPFQVRTFVFTVKIYLAAFSSGLLVRLLCSVHVSVRPPAFWAKCNGTLTRNGPVTNAVKRQVRSKTQKWRRNPPRTETAL